MQITFKHQGKTLVLDAESPSEVKLYAVPSAYSEDGYFFAVWTSGDLEPVPACATEQANLLAHVQTSEQENGPAKAQTIYCKQGVTYATH
jgi:hypothetical protein